MQSKMKRLKIICLILTLLPASSAFSMSAFWTGRQSQIQTITYKMAWKCEYRFSGHTFWMVFEGSCPSSVDVE